MNIDKAVAYNCSRPYTQEFWREIQRVVGADPDGIPGPETARQVAEYQRDNMIAVDGKAGPGTTSHITLGELATQHAQMFLDGMAICADGAPDAYHPDNWGLDYLSNARNAEGEWVGVATDASGAPHIQQSSNPCPGYYVSQTAQIDARYSSSDPRRYVDATRVLYVALPRNYSAKVGSLSTPRKGDLVAVVRGELVAFAMYSEVGPDKGPGEAFGEGSIALSRALGHDPLQVRNGIARAALSVPGDLVYLVMPGTGNGTVLTTGELYKRGKESFDAWGGLDRVRSWVTT